MASARTCRFDARQERERRMLKVILGRDLSKWAAVDVPRLHGGPRHGVAGHAGRNARRCLPDAACADIDDLAAQSLSLHLSDWI
jgi:hypothetical protein